MREDCLNKAEQALAEGKRTVAQYYSEMVCICSLKELKLFFFYLLIQL